MFVLLSSGSNAQGQLANGSVEDWHKFIPCTFSGCPPNTLPPNTNQVLTVTSGANHTLVLLEADEQKHIWGSGDGSFGQLGATYRQLIQGGAPSTIFRPIELPLEKEALSGYKPKFISASWETTYVALFREGKRDVLVSMGANDLGDLGVGIIGTGKDIPSFCVVSFDHLELHGTALKNAKISIISLAAGQHHVVVQLRVEWDNQTSRRCIVGWGASRHGQLGSVLDVRGRPVPCVPTPRIMFVEDILDPVITTALGNQHTVFLHESGRISSFGSNRKGQRQGLEDVHAAANVGCTWNGTYVVTENLILATGSGTHGQLGRQIVSDEQPSLKPVKMPSSEDIKSLKIACGTEHVILLLTRGSGTSSSSEVWGWGWNEHGNLGIGITENVFTPLQLWTPTPVEWDNSPKVVGIWGGSGTSWIATKCTSPRE